MTGLQAQHVSVALGSTHANPTRYLTARAPAPNAELGFRIDHADFYARRFDIWKSKIVHAAMLKLLEGQ